MEIDPAEAAQTIDWNGERDYFCSPACAAKFRKQHEEGPKPPAPPSRGTQWTCPMHPEIVRDGPGSCPICGMALELMTVSLDDTENGLPVESRR